ncbi:hypothetical protein BD626DRAFT_472411 [Schizophyllum amplum]|uniref:Uncharacterized protein n=1 Tax=Schizophyllum amplum TaxID=97359 RepID=A0A550CVX3_9AGAR|nr:hypothetical protein BD626DRAFT_472411 [Auriculariopsis ampla]
MGSTIFQRFLRTTRPPKLHALRNHTISNAYAEDHSAMAHRRCNCVLCNVVRDCCNDMIPAPVAAPEPPQHHGFYCRMRSRFRRWAESRHMRNHPSSTRNRPQQAPTSHLPHPRQRAPYWGRQAREQRQPADAIAPSYAPVMPPLRLPGPISLPQSMSAPTSLGYASPDPSLDQRACERTHDWLAGSEPSPLPRPYAVGCPGDAGSPSESGVYSIRTTTRECISRGP